MNIYGNFITIAKNCEQLRCFMVKQTDVSTLWTATQQKKKRKTKK